MKKITFPNIYLFILFCFSYIELFSQVDLPKGFSPAELKLINTPGYEPPFREIRGSTNPPNGPVRNMAQWEEMQALSITWRSFNSVLRDIVKGAQSEVVVIINCDNGNTPGYDDSTTIKNYLTSGGVPLTNIRFNATPTNSVWIRDYMGNSCYMNDVGQLIMVDWEYNRPRPDDDDVPNSISQMLNIPLYETTTSPNRIVATGGNYMTDGLGQSFSSKLILNENSSKTEPQINSIFNSFMGVNTSKYVKMNTLPYDVIHHIDMHMKLLDEETLLVGQYPAGTADGPQIEANLQYVLSNYTSTFGTPFKVIRIPQPPDQNNGFSYPDNGGNYLTYTNATIINKSVLVPQFYTQYDTTAIRIWQNAMPGYNIVGINSNATISSSGSIHCITHDIGAENPLLIVHQNLPNTSNTISPYVVSARIQHSSGIQSATLYYKTSLSGSYSSVAMTSGTNNNWTGNIPAQVSGTHVYYYIKGVANSGKQQVRPMPAPAGYFDFLVSNPSGIDNNSIYKFEMNAPFPNPSHGLTCIPASFDRHTSGDVKLYDMLGNLVRIIYSGEFFEGEKKFFINTLDIPSGAYLITLETKEKRLTQKLMVR